MRIKFSEYSSNLWRKRRRKLWSTGPRTTAAAFLSSKNKLKEFTCCWYGVPPTGCRVRREHHESGLRRAATGNGRSSRQPAGRGARPAPQRSSAGGDVPVLLEEMRRVVADFSAIGVRAVLTSDLLHPRQRDLSSHLRDIGPTLGHRDVMLLRHGSTL